MPSPTGPLSLIARRRDGASLVRDRAGAFWLARPQNVAQRPQAAQVPLSSRLSSSIGTLRNLASLGGEHVPALLRGILAAPQVPLGVTRGGVSGGLQAASGATGVLAALASQVPALRSLNPALTNTLTTSSGFKIPGITGLDALGGAVSAAGGIANLAEGNVGPGLGSLLQAGTSFLTGPGAAAALGIPLLAAQLSPQKPSGIPEILGSLFGFGTAFGRRQRKKGPGILPATESIPGLRDIEGLLKGAADAAGLGSPGGTTTLGGTMAQHPLAGSVMQGGVLHPDPGTILAELAPRLARPTLTRRPTAEGVPEAAPFGEQAALALGQGGFSPAAAPYVQAITQLLQQQITQSPLGQEHPELLPRLLYEAGLSSPGYVPWGEASA